MSLYRKKLLIPALGKEAWELGLEFAENCLMKQFWGGGGVRFTGYIDQRNAVHIEHPAFTENSTVISRVFIICQALGM